MARVLVASLGFTVDFSVRRVAELGPGEVRRFIGVAVRAGDDAWRRVEEAYSLLRHYLSSLGIEASLEEVPPGRGMLPRLRDVLARAASLAGPDGLVEVYVTGGPRMLALGLTIAALTSSEPVRDRVVVTARGEGFPGELAVHAGKLARLLSLDQKSLEILRTLARLQSARADVLLNLVSVRRSTLYYKLSKLEEEGLVVRESGEWRIHPDLEGLI